MTEDSHADVRLAGDKRGLLTPAVSSEQKRKLIFKKLSVEIFRTYQHKIP
jgi:hypothetical protein